MQDRVETIGDRIRRSRQDAELTQPQLAKLCGVSAAAVAQWETGDSKSVKAEYIFKLGRALNKDPEWLLTGKGNQLPLHFIGEAIEALPNSNGQMQLDLLGYSLDRAGELIARDKYAHYGKMIEAFKADLSKRRKRDK